MKELTEEEKERIIKKVVHSFACEGMIITEDEIARMRPLLDGTKTVEQLIAEETELMRKEGLID